MPTLSALPFRRSYWFGLHAQRRTHATALRFAVLNSDRFWHRYFTCLYLAHCGRLFGHTRAVLFVASYAFRLRTPARFLGCTSTSPARMPLHCLPPFAFLLRLPFPACATIPLYISVTAHIAFRCLPPGSRYHLVHYCRTRRFVMIPHLTYSNREHYFTFSHHVPGSRGTRCC